jgi:hypothetical protein
VTRRLRRCRRTDARKCLGDPTPDDVSSGTGQAPVSRARSTTAGTATELAVFGLLPVERSDPGDVLFARDVQLTAESNPEEWESVNLYPMWTSLGWSVGCAEHG